MQMTQMGTNATNRKRETQNEYETMDRVRDGRGGGVGRMPEQGQR
jgi:hypothetical protein